MDPTVEFPLVWCKQELDLSELSNEESGFSRFRTVINNKSSALPFKEMTAPFSQTAQPLSEYFHPNKVGLLVTGRVESYNPQSSIYFRPFIGVTSPFTTIVGAHFEGSRCTFLTRLRDTNDYG